MLRRDQINSNDAPHTNSTANVHTIPAIVMYCVIPLAASAVSATEAKLLFMDTLNLSGLTHPPLFVLNVLLLRSFTVSSSFPCRAVVTSSVISSVVGLEYDAVQLKSITYSDSIDTNRSVVVIVVCFML